MDVPVSGTALVVRWRVGRHRHGFVTLSRDLRNELYRLDREDAAVVLSGGAVLPVGPGVAEGSRVAHVDSVWAAYLGIEDGTEAAVGLYAGPVTPVSRVTVETVDEGDYEILELNAARFQASMLNQVRLVQPGGVIVAFVDNIHVAMRIRELWCFFLWHIK